MVKRKNNAEKASFSVAMAVPFSETSTKYEEYDKYACDYFWNKGTYAHKIVQILKFTAIYILVFILFHLEL